MRKKFEIEGPGPPQTPLGPFKLEKNLKQRGGQKTSCGKTKRDTVAHSRARPGEEGEKSSQNEQEETRKTTKEGYAAPHETTKREAPRCVE
jgi:hypothetical protein